MMGRITSVLFCIFCLVQANRRRFYLVETEDDSDKILDNYEDGEDYAEEDTDELEKIAQNVISKELPKREKEVLESLPKIRQKEIKEIEGKERIISFAMIVGFLSHSG